jgi:hypothetical protein
MNNKVMIPVLIAIIVIGGIAYASMLKKSPVANPAVVQTTNTAPSSSVTTSTNTNQSQPVTTTTSSKDCGTDVNCFIAQANTCGPASVEFTATILKELTASSHIVIGKSATAGSCTFNERTDKVLVRGKEDASTVGTTIACSAVPSAKIVATLTNWNEDTFSSEDFVNGSNCKTTLPKAYTDELKQEEQQQANTPYTPPVDNINGPHEVFTGLGAGSDIAGNSYQMYIAEVTNNSATLQMRDSNGDNPPTTVILALNAPQTYFGHSFALTAVTKDAYTGDYIGTITVDQN